MHACVLWLSPTSPPQNLTIAQLIAHPSVRYFVYLLKTDQNTSLYVYIGSDYLAFRVVSNLPHTLQSTCSVFMSNRMGRYYKRPCYTIGTLGNHRFSISFIHIAILPVYTKIFGKRQFDRLSQRSIWDDLYRAIIRYMYELAKFKSCFKEISTVWYNMSRFHEKSNIIDSA